MHNPASLSQLSEMTMITLIYILITLVEYDMNTEMDCKRHAFRYLV